MWTFLIISFLVLAAIVFFMPKRLSKIDLYMNYFFILLLNWSFNVVIDAKYDLRGFFQKGPDYPTMLIFIIVFPCFGLIFLNLYPYKSNSKIIKIFCIFSFAAIFFLYELLMIKFNVLYFRNWNYFYSMVLYLVSLICYLLNIKLTKYLKVEFSQHAAQENAN